MTTRRCYWGDLRLPKRVRRLEIGLKLQGPQVHKGLDRDDAAILAINKNWHAKLDVKTFWDPEATFTREDHERFELAYLVALKSRTNSESGPWPLFEVFDDDVTVSSYSLPTVNCSGAHGMSNGDLVLVRRSGVGLYTYGAVSSVAATSFQLAGPAITPTSGDNVLPVHRYWLEAALASPPALKMNDKGNHFEAVASHSFLADQDGINGKPAAVDLDA